MRSCPHNFLYIIWVSRNFFNCEAYVNFVQGSFTFFLQWKVRQSPLHRYHFMPVVGRVDNDKFIFLILTTFGPLQNMSVDSLEM